MRQLYRIQVRLIIFSQTVFYSRLENSCLFSFEEFEAGSICNAVGGIVRGILFPAGTLSRSEFIKNKEEIGKPVLNESFNRLKNARKEVLCEG